MTSTQNSEYDYEEKFQKELKEIKSNSLKQKLVAIKNIVLQRLTLEKEFKNLNFQLEAKYDAIYKPIYDQRQKIIEGTEEVKIEEINDQLEKVSLSAESLSAVPVVESEKGIPEFWLKCFKNSAQFGEIINKKDELILKHLKDLTCEFKENGTFLLSFLFESNDYFDCTALTREFILDSEKLTISKIVSTKINWKNEAANPTVQTKDKKIKNKKGGVKVIKKVEEIPSFFNFFKDYDVSKMAKKDKQDEPDDEDEEGEEDELDIIEEEYDLGLFIKEELIPYAIEYYLGIIQDDGFGDEELEDEDDEDDDEEDVKPMKKKGNKH